MRREMSFQIQEPARNSSFSSGPQEQRNPVPDLHPVKKVTHKVPKGYVPDRCELLNCEGSVPLSVTDLELVSPTQFRNIV